MISYTESAYCIDLDGGGTRVGAKGKGGRGKYTDLNAEFQRIARRDKKAFLSDQCKEIKEMIEWKD